MSRPPFPTGQPDGRGIAPPPGLPFRASHCRCDRPLALSDGHCIRCGRDQKQTIHETFQVRAETLRVLAARKQRKTGRRRSA